MVQFFRINHRLFLIRKKKVKGMKLKNLGLNFLYIFAIAFFVLLLTRRLKFGFGELGLPSLAVILAITLTPVISYLYMGSRTRSKVILYAGFIAAGGAAWISFIFL